MKNEDFERLKAVCEKEGFEIIQDAFVEIDGTIAFVRKKNIWDRVEFAESKSYGAIYKIISQTYDSIIYNLRGLRGLSEGGESYEYFKSEFQPSDEQAYVDQLKEEAFKMFGDIKAGDRFDESGIDGCYFKSRLVGSVKFIYYKCLDILCVGEVTLYRQGKWATKLKERVRVTQADLDNRDMRNNFHFRLEFASNITKTKEHIIAFLSEQLEKYLNDEI